MYPSHNNSHHQLCSRGLAGNFSAFSFPVSWSCQERGLAGHQRPVLPLGFEGELGGSVFPRLAVWSWLYADLLHIQAICTPLSEGHREKGCSSVVREVLKGRFSWLLLLGCLGHNVGLPCLTGRGHSLVGYELHGHAMVGSWDQQGGVRQWKLTLDSILLWKEPQSLVASLFRTAFSGVLTDGPLLTE